MLHKESLKVMLKRGLQGRVGATEGATAPLAGMNKGVKPVVVLVFMAVLLLSGSAMAGAAMPWDSGLKQFADALTGTTAMYVCLIAAAFTAYQMVWGGEMTDFGRKVTMTVLVTSFIVGLAAFLKSVCGLQITGSVIALASFM